MKKTYLKIFLFFTTLGIFVFYFANSFKTNALIGGGCTGSHICIDNGGEGGGAQTYGITISIFSISDSSSSSSFGLSGHSFITVENISTNHTIVIGYMSITPGNTVSIGTWGNQGYNGIWYNLELYSNHNLPSSYNGRVSLSETKSYSTLQSLENFLVPLNAYILNNNSWSILYNCSSFASGVWNSISTRTVTAGTPNNPTALRNSIKSHSNYYQNNRYMPNNINVGYYTTNGNFVPWANPKILAVSQACSFEGTLKGME